MTEFSPVVRNRRERQQRSEDGSKFTLSPTQGGAEDLVYHQEKYRQEAWVIYNKIPYPARTDEPWRRTDINKIEFGKFSLSNDDLADAAGVQTDSLILDLVRDKDLLVIGDTPVLQHEHLMDAGVVIADLKTAADKYPEVIERIGGKVVSPDDGKFAALTAAMANTGLLFYVPRGVIVDEPFKVISWLSQPGRAYFNHVMVYLEENSEATLFFETASDSNVHDEIFHSLNFEVIIGRSAHLKLVELQNLGRSVLNFSHERIRVSENASLNWFYGAFGSKLTKTFLDVDLAESGANAKINGAYVSDGTQHLDLDTQQNHLAPHTTSDLKFKGVLLQNSRAIWQGMVYVSPEAQKTDGYQTNNNLVLSSAARADSIPGLEILADDVRCSHGATVGKIDEDEVFYLRTRGIPKEEAEQLLVEGFFSPVLNTIDSDDARINITEWVQNNLRLNYVNKQ